MQFGGAAVEEVVAKNTHDNKKASEQTRVTDQDLCECIPT
jgi:hypothetical protein